MDLIGGVEAVQEGVPRLPHLSERLEALQWARSFESDGDDPRARASNTAVEGYLAGVVTRRKLRGVAYIDDSYAYVTPGEVMASFAAEVALAGERDWEGTINEARAKWQEYVDRLDPAAIDPNFPDAHRWTPAEADAELAEWESILGRRA